MFPGSDTGPLSNGVWSFVLRSLRIRPGPRVPLCPSVHGNHRWNVHLEANRDPNDHSLKSTAPGLQRLM